MLRAIFENVLITCTIEVSLNLDYEIPYTLLDHPVGLCPRPAEKCRPIETEYSYVLFHQKYILPKL